MINLGSTELFFILVIILVLFGGGKLANVGTSLGKGMRNFRKSFSGDDDDEQQKIDPPKES